MRLIEASQASLSYIGSIAGRSTGIAISNNWQEYLQSLPDGSNVARIQREKGRGPGVYAGFVQTVLLPATMSNIMGAMIGFKEYSFLPKSQDENATLLDASKVAFGVLVDAASLAYVLSNSHNLAEFVVWRLAANAAAHVGLDIISNGINRIKTFRPTATTLAV